MGYPGTVIIGPVSRSRDESVHEITFRRQSQQLHDVFSGDVVEEPVFNCGCRADHARMPLPAIVLHKGDRAGHRKVHRSLV